MITLIKIIRVRRKKCKCEPSHMLVPCNRVTIP